MQQLMFMMRLVVVAGIHIHYILHLSEMVIFITIEVVVLLLVHLEVDVHEEEDFVIVVVSEGDLTIYDTHPIQSNNILNIFRKFVINLNLEAAQDQDEAIHEKQDLDRIHHLDDTILALGNNLEDLNLLVLIVQDLYLQKD